MVDVIATQRGYFGGEIREPGAPFDVPDEIWDDKKRRPKWAKAVKPESKGDAEDAPKPETAAEKKARLAAEKAAAKTAEPFADAPEPVRVENEVNKLTGATEPDWIAPKAID